jgi:hypothetical protein
MKVFFARAGVSLGVLLLGMASLSAQQQPAPAPAPAAASPVAAPSPAASPAGATNPAAPGTVSAGPAAAAKVEPPPPPADQKALIDAFSLGELQEAINLLRANYIKPGDVDDRAIARATLSGLLDRLDDGAMILPGRSASAPAKSDLPDVFRSEVLGERIGYARLGSLTKEHLADLDRALKGFADQSLPAVVLDLRATPPSGDFELAAEVIRRFTPKGKPLFTLRKPSTNQERLFTSNADPAYNGLVLLLVDGDTAGAPETIPAAIRNNSRAMIVGSPTAGQAVEYSDLGLGGGRVLRVVVSQVLLPTNVSIFPAGVKPDLAISLSKEDKQTIFKQSLDKGLAGFVFETERPHMNEAALVSGQNPELDAARDAQAARRRGGPPTKPPLRDTVLQRALDLATTVTVFSAAPKPPDPR